MEEEAALSKVAMHITRGCLVVPIQVELHDELVPQIQRNILEMVNRTGIRRVIIDVSGVAIIDSFLGRAICDTARMATLLGATTVVTGIRPGVAASLIDLDFELGGIPTAITLEEGFRTLESLAGTKQQVEETEETEEEADEEPQGQADEDEGEDEE